MADQGPLFQEKGKSREEIEALSVAEEARESEWTKRSFVADLCMGNLHVESVWPFPAQDPEDRRIGDEFLDRLEKFLDANLDADQIDETGQIPDSVMKGLAELGAFGMKIPKEYGGLGLSQMNYGRALGLVSEYDASTAVMLSAHQSIGVPQPLTLFGTEEQKKKYLPRIARGAVSAFALTEPEVGSDPARMQTTATPTEDGNFYLINGTKLWCTNAVIAEVVIVMARTPSVFERGKEKKQITAFIVTKDMPGFEVVHRSRFAGLNGIQNGVLRFTNLKVPKENILWGPGKGLRLALITLNTGRLSLPAATVGGGRECLRISARWGKSRQQWGAPVGKHEAGATKIASMASSIFASDAMTTLTEAWVDNRALDGGHDIRLEAAMAKLFGSEQAETVIENTLQLRGGRGYERASSLRARGEEAYPVERMWRDARINLIVEGTSEILRLFIAREALDRHLRIAGDVLNPRLSMGKRIRVALKAASFYVWWYPLQWLGPVLALFQSRKYSELRGLSKHMRYAASTAHRLARTIFHLMLRHGPALEKRQLQLFRVVDIATELFAMASSVGYAQALVKSGEGIVNAEYLADVFCRESRVRIEAAFHALGMNCDRSERELAKRVLNGEFDWLMCGATPVSTQPRTTEHERITRAAG